MQTRQDEAVQKARTEEKAIAKANVHKTINEFKDQISVLQESVATMQ